MKRFLCLLCILTTSFTLFSGCKTNEEDLYIYTSEKEYGIIDLLSVTENKYTVLSYYDGNIFLYEFSGDDAKYYLYNTKTTELIQVGTIINFRISSNECAFLDNKFYWNVGIGKSTADIINAFYSFDIVTGDFVKIKEEKLYQTLVNSFTINNSIISFKGNLKNERNSVTYLEAYTSDNDHTVILSKEGTIDDGYGDFITASCGYKNTICIMNNSDKKYFIEKYDSDGDMLKKYDATEIMELLNKQYISQFVLLDEVTLFINNLSGDSVLCSLDENELTITSSSTYEQPLYVAKSCRPHNSEAIVYQLESNRMYRLIENKLLMNELNSDGILQYVFVDGSDVLYSYLDGTGSIKTYLQTVDELFSN